MLDTKFRHLVQEKYVDPIAQLCSKQGATALSLTLLAAILGVGALPYIACGYKVWGMILLLLSGYCDMLDGTLARLTQSESHFGAACDICADRLVEFTSILGLYLLAPQERGLFCLLMLGSVLLCVTSFLVVGIFSQNSSEKSFHYSPGLIERTEAFLFFALMILLPSLFNALSIVFSTLVCATAAYRLYEFRPAYFRS